MCGYTVKIKRKRVGYVCGGKNKNKKEKTKIKKQNEDIERRRVGTCVKEKKPRKPKKKSFWVGLNSLQITEILINFKGPVGRVVQTYIFNF